MPPRNAKGRPLPKADGPENNIIAATMVADPAAQLQAWRQTVEHLHALGLPAPAPEFVSAWLRRQGIRPDWETAA